MSPRVSALPEETVVMAGLLHVGVGAGALIAFIAAKTLLSAVRMITYEAPLLGWPLTLARLLPGLLVPPLLGVAGQWLLDSFKQH